MSHQNQSQLQQQKQIKYLEALQERVKTSEIKKALAEKIKILKTNKPVTK